MRLGLSTVFAIVCAAGLARASTTLAPVLLHVERGGVWATVTPLHDKYFITWMNTNQDTLRIDYVETFSTGKNKTLKVTLKPHQQLQDKHHRSKDLIVAVQFKDITIKD